MLRELQTVSRPSTPRYPARPLHDIEQPFAPFRPQNATASAAPFQGDASNRASVPTVVVVVLTSNVRLASAAGNVRLASAAGNVLLPKKATGLDRESVANVSQLAAVDREFLRDPSGRLPPAKIEAILRSVDVMLGR